MPLAYSEVAPFPALAGFIKCFWTLQGEPDGPPAMERILPDGALELVFHFGQPFTSLAGLQPRAMLVGEICRPTLITPSSRPDVLGVRFRVGGASAFFREPLAVFRGLMVPLEDVLDGWQRVMEAGNAASRISILQGLLHSRLKVSDRWKNANAVAGLIAAREGQVRLPQLARATGSSERAIERAFQECVGMTPKTFARLARFHAYLAAPLRDHGYVDDAHLTRDFHSFAGITPGQFRRETHAISDAFFEGSDPAPE